MLNWVDIRRALRRIRTATGHTDIDPDAAADIGRLVARSHALRFTGYRGAARSLRGQDAPELLKLVGSETLQAAWDLATVLAGPNGALDPELVVEDFDALGATIYGGTSEIQRTLIAERVLGLPR